MSIELVGQLIAATRNAKARTGNKNLGTCAAKGGIMVVDVEMNAKGKSTVKYLTAVIPMADAIKFLNSL